MRPLRFRMSLQCLQQIKLCCGSLLAWAAAAQVNKLLQFKLNWLRLAFAGGCKVASGKVLPRQAGGRAEVRWNALLRAIACCKLCALQATMLFWN